MMRHPHRLILLAFALIALPTHADAPLPRANAALQLPELGRSADQVVDHGTEMRLGQAWLRQLRASTPTWPDPLIGDYLENLLYKLSLQTTLQDPRFSLVVVDDTSVNAFAVPGEVVGVNTGLLLTSETEGELAGVLSHELGHLSQRHFARSQQDNQASQWIALGGLLASIAAAAAAGPASGNLGYAAGLSAQALAAQSQLRYSRAYEQEADRIGMQTLTDAGYDPRAMPAFFLRLDRSTRQLGFLPEFLLTHPLSSSRLSDLERRVSDTPRKLTAEDPTFSLMQVRLQVAYHAQPEELVNAWRKQQAEGSAPENVRYGLALALLRLNQIEAAREQLQPLLQASPSRLAYRVAALDIRLAQRDYAGALQAGLQDMAWYPLRRSVLERTTRAALALNQPERIRERLEAEARRVGNDPLLWRLLSDCATSQKDALTVFRARAELMYLTNRMRAAEDQLRNAIKLARGNYSLTAQLEHRLGEMRALDGEFRR